MRIFVYRISRLNITTCLARYMPIEPAGSYPSLNWLPGCSVLRLVKPFDQFKISVYDRQQLRCLYCKKSDLHFFCYPCHYRSLLLLLLLLIPSIALHSLFHYIFCWVQIAPYC